jgi:hypothetical protein
MHGPIFGPGHVLAAAAGRLSPLAVIHLEGRLVRRNLARGNPAEQERGSLHTVGCISFQAPNDVGGAFVLRFGLLFRADFTTPRAASTGAPTTMLSEWGYIEVIEIVRHWHQDKSRLRSI